jgi:hypothetical protein
MFGGMAVETVLWIYFANFIFLIIHEMDSAYWEEWKLFKLPGGITGFLGVHVPLFSFFMYGLIQVHDGTRIGLVFSLFLSLSGLFAFTIHTYFMRKGREEFNTLASKAILTPTLILSIIQLVSTVLLLPNPT